MSRPIKFRAWDKSKNKWYDLECEHMNPLTGKIMVDEDNSCGDPNCCGGPSPLWDDKDHIELNQFTGLLDRNGKEIYEGDILCVFDECVVPVTDDGQGPIESCNHLVRVEYRDCEFGFQIPKSDGGETGWFNLKVWIEEISDNGYEIVGTAYENPELLESSNAK